MLFSPCLILLSLYPFTCKAIPPGLGLAKTHSRGLGFTEEEDQFIVDELSRLNTNNQEFLRKSLWNHLADEHRKKREQGTPGFPQERTAKSINGRFKTMVMQRYPFLKGKLPENLLRKYRIDVNKSPQRKRPYTEQEDKFMIEELLKTSSDAPYSAETWESLLAKHELKRQAGTPGFQSGRSTDGLRLHLYGMKNKGQLPHDLVKKIRKYTQDASSSDVGCSDEQTALEL